MARQLQVVVSHSHEDNAFCREVVAALRGAGADVWYDEHNLGSGQLMEVIQRELDQRPIFVLILSKHACASRWVKREATWAFLLADRDPWRLILPVTAGPIEDSDFSGAAGWLFLSDFKRIEAFGMKRFPIVEACGRLLHALALTPGGATRAAPAPMPQPNESVDELLSQGRVLAAQRKHAEAIPFLERATQLDPRNFEAWANLGLAYNEMSRHSDGLTANDRALALDDKQPWVWNNKGYALNEPKRYGDALLALERALLLNPTYAEAWSHRGVALYRLGRYDEALAAFEHALATHPEDAGTLAYKRKALRRLGRDTEAGESGRQDANRQAEQRTLFAPRAELTSKADDVDKGAPKRPAPGGVWAAGASQSTKIRVESNPQLMALLEPDARHPLRATKQVARMSLELGVTYLNNHRSGEAVIAFNRTLKLDPENAYAWYYKGLALNSLNRHSEALEAYDRALSLEPNLVEAQQGKAVALQAFFRVGEVGRTERRLRELNPTTSTHIADTPNHAESLSQLLSRAGELINQNEYAEAVSFLETATQREPRSFDAWAILGIAYNELGWGADGLAACNSALALNPKDAITWREKGYALLLLERHKEALAAYNCALDLDPSLVVAWDGRGTSLRKLERYDEALIAFDLGLALEEDNTSILNSKAIALRLLGRTAEAEQV